MSGNGKEVDESKEVKRPVWQDDKVWAQCGEAGCGIRFGLTVRKHHCRNCGYIFCDEHSRRRVAIEELGYEAPVRICMACYDRRRHTHPHLNLMQY